VPELIASLLTNYVQGDWQEMGVASTTSCPFLSASGNGDSFSVIYGACPTGMQNIWQAVKAMDNSAGSSRDTTCRGSSASR